MKMIRIVGVLTVLVALVSCKKEEPQNGNEPPQGEPTVISKFHGFNPGITAVPQTGPGTLYSGVNVSTTISGVVYNPSGQPVSNATVHVNGSTTTTDASGRFLFTNIAVDQSRAYVKVAKNGYFPGAKTFKPQAGKVSNVSVYLIPQLTAGTFLNATGGSVTVGNDVTLTFDGGDVSYPDGSSYSGNVYVTAAYLDPLDGFDQQKVPGDFRAIRANGEEVIITNHGILAIELVGDASQELNVAPGETVAISMNIPAAFQSNAPAIVPVYSFDEVQGNWAEEGTFTRNGNAYEGELAHFSFWTNGLWLPPRDFYCQVVGPSGDPVMDSKVTFTGSNNEYWGGIHTDGTGILDGPLPATVDVIFTIYDDCGTQLYQQNLGNGSAAINLGTVMITPSSEMGLLTGSAVDCQGVGIPSATVSVDDGTDFDLFETDANGDFAVYISHCNIATTVIAYDFVNIVQSSDTLVAPGSAMNLGALDVCVPPEEYVYFTLDGTYYSTIETAGSNYIKALRSEFLNGNPNSDSLCIEAYPFSGTFGEFWFYIPSINPGIYPNCEMPQVDPLANIPIIDMIVNMPGTAFDAGPNSITVDLTSYGGMGGYAEGTFSGTFTDDQGGPHTITGGQFRAYIQN